MAYVIKKFLTAALATYVAIAALMLVFSWADSASALDISDTIRTVPLNEAGEQVTLSVEDLSKGQRKFNSTCVQCHLDGGSKTNPDVDLGPETLSRATPARNNIESIVDYLHSPTTYDGLSPLAEFHPSVDSADLFPRMKTLTEDDLRAIAGYILVEPNIVGDQWAGGKPNR